MSERIQNPFEAEKPQLVHIEKSQDHYEYCRMQMHEIERTHRRTFLVNTVLCILVCFLAIFHIYLQGFGFFSIPTLSAREGPQAVLAGGIFQIIIAMVIIILGYLAWANYHFLNVILAGWYALVMGFGVFRVDYLSAVVGVCGVVFYLFSLREIRHEESLAEMEGYPDFQEKFDISKSDIVIQTLLAHKGEHRTKSTLFTTDYSLRRMKKKSNSQQEPEESHNGQAGAALAESLQKLTRSQDPMPGVIAERETVQLSKEAADAGMQEVSAKPVGSDADAEAAAIIAEAEAKAKAILEEALAKAQSMKKTDSQ